MKRTEAKALQTRYGMEILRHPITSEAWALSLVSAAQIPELDDLVNTDLYPCMMQVEYIDQVYYRLICPTNWFDLWGWIDD